MPRTCRNALMIPTLARASPSALPSACPLRELAEVSLRRRVWALRRSSYWLRCSGVRWIMSSTWAASVKAGELNRCSMSSVVISSARRKKYSHASTGSVMTLLSLGTVYLGNSRRWICRPSVRSRWPSRLRSRKSLWICGDSRNRIGVQDADADSGPQQRVVVAFADLADVH